MPHSEPYVNNRVVNERMIHRILKYEIFIFKMQHKIIKQVYKKKLKEPSGTLNLPYQRLKSNMRFDKRIF